MEDHQVYINQAKHSMQKIDQRITIVGATGNVGRKVVEMILQQHLITPENIRLTASSTSAGNSIISGQYDFIVEDTGTVTFQPNEICIFNTEADISAKYIPIALDSGAYVVDSSSHYRLHSSVPLIVPPVNLNLVLNSSSMLYSHANCIVAPIAIAINPIYQRFGIDRMIVSTYQSVSGAGKRAMDECVDQTKSIVNGIPIKCRRFPRQIAFNVIPQIGAFNKDGFSSEEFKIIEELKKIIDKSIYITATAVRVPVMVGHSVSISIRITDQTCGVSDITQLLSEAKNVRISDDYHTPIEIDGSDDVFVGRIRCDESNDEKWFHMWLCSDNVRVGAATDAVEIAAAIIQKKNK